MTTVRLRNARERLSHTVLAIADGAAGEEDLRTAEHALARAIDWRALTNDPPTPTALQEARTQTEAAIADLPVAARERVRARLE